MKQPQAITQSLNLPDGREIVMETGRMARLADGSVTVTCGGTMVMATVVASKDVPDDVDFMPLTVDYKEKYSASGKFPGGFFKREGRPTEDEILNCRLVDRALRPMFPDDYHANTQVILQLFSYDHKNQPSSLLGLAASAALQVSDVPFNGPISEVRVGRVNGELVLNPTADMEGKMDLDIMVAGSAKDIVMLEGEMEEITEEEMVKAIEFAQKAIAEQCDAQLELAKKAGAPEKREYCHEKHDEDLKKEIRDFAFERCMDIARQGIPSKSERGELFSAVYDEYLETKTDEEKEENAFLIKQYFKATQKEAVREVILSEGKRLDGRQGTDIRPIWCEVDLLPGAHGSALFTRGETQSLTSLTLGGKQDEQLVDSATAERNDTFMLHYNFPPFSVGEARFLRGASRREIGHGNLALRALKGQIPTEEEGNPYTIRLVSEILESNGSSSMATVCAGCLSLLDGGVKLKKHVSGIAMGLITDDKGRYAVLSDILGDEDHLGDMDFKVCGTRQGITACQMDIKIDGLSYDVLIQALNQAKDGRMHILGKLEETIDTPRDDYKPNAPRIVSFQIPGDLIGAIIGPGGKIIQEIQRESNTVVSIDETDDNKFGIVQIMAENLDGLQMAEKRIKSIAFPPTVEIGEEYEGPVKSIMPYGAFVEIVPGTDGLIHISEFEWAKIDKVEDVVSQGEIVKFKVTGKDPKTGKLKLSRRVLLPKPEGYVEPAPRGNRNGGGRKPERHSDRNS